MEEITEETQEAIRTDIRKIVELIQDKSGFYCLNVISHLTAITASTFDSGGDTFLDVVSAHAKEIIEKIERREKSSGKVIH